jgi:hypothetical protein
MNDEAMNDDRPDDKYSDDVDGWSDEPRDPDAGGPPAEFVDTPVVPNRPDPSDVPNPKEHLAGEEPRK